MSMLRKTLSSMAPCAVILLGMAAGASAQYNLSDAPVKGRKVVKLPAALVKTGLYTISGGGCNSLLRLTANGLIVVDGKLPGNYEAFLATAKKIVDQPVRVLITTSSDQVSIGNNAKFVEDGAKIFAHQNLRAGGLSAAKIVGAVPPNVTYDREYALHLGGVDSKLMHFENAYTAGDTVVYFPNLKVVAVGNLLAPTPTPDYSRGGSLVGWGSALAQILKLDFDVVVPRTGPVATRADLIAYKAKVDKLIARASELVSSGVGKDQLLARLKTDDLGWSLSFAGNELDRFYADFRQTKN